MVSDVIVLYLLKKGGFYRRNKYQQVNESEGEEGYEVITNPPATKDPENQPIQVTVRSFPLQVSLYTVVDPTRGVTSWGGTY